MSGKHIPPFYKLQNPHKLYIVLHGPQEEKILVDYNASIKYDKILPNKIYIYIYYDKNEKSVSKFCFIYSRPKAFV